MNFYRFTQKKKKENENGFVPTQVSSIPGDNSCIHRLKEIHVSLSIAATQ